MQYAKQVLLGGHWVVYVLQAAEMYAVKIRLEVFPGLAALMSTGESRTRILFLVVILRFFVH